MASQWPPKKNAAFTLYFSLYKSDGTIIANPGTITKKVSIDGAAVADITAAVTEEDVTYGQLSVVLASGEMNGDAIWVYIVDDTAGCVPFTCTIYTAGSLHDEMKADTAAILVDTAEIGTAGAGLTNINLPNQTMDIVGNITGTLSGSVGSVATGGITAASFAAGAIDAAAIAANAIDSASLAADVTTRIENAVWDAVRASHITAGSFGDIDTTADVADAVLDEVVEGSYTLRQLIRLVAAAAGAKLSGAATTSVAIRDLGDTKDRIAATVDADGNRSAITLDLT